MFSTSAPCFLNPSDQGGTDNSSNSATGGNTENNSGSGNNSEAAVAKRQELINAMTNKDEKKICWS